VDGADNHCASVVNSLAAFLIGAGEGSFYACSRDWQVDPLWPAEGHPSDWMTWHAEVQPAARGADGAGAGDRATGCGRAHSRGGARGL